MSRSGKVVIVLFFGLILTLVVGSLIDGSGNRANYDVKLFKSTKGWTCRLFVINASPGKRLHFQLHDVKLNGVPWAQSDSDATIPDRGIQTVDLQFPESAASEGSKATLNCWVKLSGFGTYSNTARQFDVYPQGADTDVAVPSDRTGDPSRPFLSLARSARGWACRFNFTNKTGSSTEFLVARSFLNGQEAVLYPGEWIVQPGETVELDAIFPETAAESRVPATFQGHYQLHRPGSDNYDFRDVSTQLTPP